MIRAIKRCLGTNLNSPIPALSELDRSEDGALDLRQLWVTGRFRSKKLEAAYSMHKYATWRPKLRIILCLMVAIEAYSVIAAFYCECGLRFGTYTGGYLIHASTFPLAVMVFTIAVLSPKLSRWMAPRFVAVIASLALMLAAGYVLPLITFLHANPLVANATFGEMESVVPRVAISSVWSTSLFAIVFTVFSTFATSLGSGVVAYALVSPVIMGLYVLYTVVWFDHNFGFVSIAVPQTTVIFYILNVLVSYVHSSSSRHHYILSIYAQNEREVRVEQLQREKQRLDYERQFANQQLHVASILAGHPAGWQSEGDEEAALRSVAPEDEGVGGSSDGGWPPRRRGGASSDGGWPHRCRVSCGLLARRATMESATSSSSRNIPSEPELASLAQRQGSSFDGGLSPQRPRPRGSCSLGRSSTSRQSAASTDSRTFSEPELASLAHTVAAEGAHCQRISNHHPRTSRANSPRGITHGAAHTLRPARMPSSDVGVAGCTTLPSAPLDVLLPRLRPPPRHSTQATKPRPRPGFRLMRNLSSTPSPGS